MSAAPASAVEPPKSDNDMAIYPGATNKLNQLNQLGQLGQLSQASQALDPVLGLLSPAFGVLNRSDFPAGVLLAGDQSAEGSGSA
ncbi:hypothetical protein GCM10010446_40590 [Streptomyces enissocaesilis]|uniref:Uncharacterized protein n=1 Tax=Streptomyces enissocaesilis TaxID=332589 RepID=A0ABN3XHG0_9ACTN